jgi:hypothetical protein
VPNVPDQVTSAAVNEIVDFRDGHPRSLARHRGGGEVGIEPDIAVARDRRAIEIARVRRLCRSVAGSRTSHRIGDEGDAHGTARGSERGSAAQRVGPRWQSAKRDRRTHCFCGRCRRKQNLRGDCDGGAGSGCQHNRVIDDVVSTHSEIGCFHTYGGPVAGAMNRRPRYLQYVG